MPLEPYTGMVIHRPGIGDAVSNLLDSLQGRAHEKRLLDQQQATQANVTKRAAVEQITKDMDYDQKRAFYAANPDFLDAHFPELPDNADTIKAKEVKRILLTDRDPEKAKAAGMRPLQPHEVMIQDEFYNLKHGEAGATALTASAFGGTPAGKQSSEISAGIAQNADQAVRSKETTRHNVVEEGQTGPLRKGQTAEAYAAADAHRQASKDTMRGQFTTLTDQDGNVVGAWNPKSKEFVPAPIQGARKSGVSATERKEAGEAAGMMSDLSRLEQLATKNKAWIGPVAGRWNPLVGKAKDLPEDVGEMYQISRSLNQRLLYLRSGKQINEQEYNRLKAALPGVEQPTAQFFVNLKRFGKEMSQMASHNAALRNEVVTNQAGNPAAIAPLAPSKGGVVTDPNHALSLFGKR